MTKYQEYCNAILAIHSRYMVRPNSLFYDGPMLDEEFGKFLEAEAKQEFGIEWDDVEKSWINK